MNENLHLIFTNFSYALPVVGILNALFLYWQKSQLKNANQKSVLSQTFIIRNTIFVMLLAFVIIYSGQNIPSYDEFMKIGPVPF